MNEDVKAIFEENILGTLATVNQDGSPWATPLHIVTDGDAVYWFSSEKAEHSQNIEQDSRVSLALFSPDKSEGLKAIYIQGRVQKVPKEGIDAAREIYAKRVGFFSEYLKSAAAYRLPIGQLDGVKTVGKCWYFHS